MKLGILGGGQLAYMLCENMVEEINNIIEKVYIFSNTEDIPCNMLKTNNKIWLNVRPPLIKSSNQIIDELKKII